MASQVSHIRQLTTTTTTKGARKQRPSQQAVDVELLHTIKGLMDTVPQACDHLACASCIAVQQAMQENIPRALGTVHSQRGSASPQRSSPGRQDQPAPGVQHGQTPTQGVAGISSQARGCLPCTYLIQITYSEQPLLRHACVQPWKDLSQVNAALSIIRVRHPHKH